MSDGWKKSAELFFANRAHTIDGVPNLEDLCYIAGRDPRVWADRALYEDLIQSIADQLELEPSHRLLEVGCASGFLARGLAPRCRAYVGIDMANGALTVARRLGLANAEFSHRDANRTGFPDGSFDRVVSYDVFTNFPSMDVATPIVTEMLRVVRPGGVAMVGSIPDEEHLEEASARAVKLGEELTRTHGPLPTDPLATRTTSRLQRWIGRFVKRPEPGIVCFSFRRSDFRSLGSELGVETEIQEIHAKNPYVGCRFNAVFRRPS